MLSVTEWVAEVKGLGWFARRVIEVQRLFFSVQEKLLAKAA